MSSKIEFVAMKGGYAFLKVADYWAESSVVLSPQQALSLGERLVAIGNRKAVPGETLEIQKGAL